MDEETSEVVTAAWWVWVLLSLTACISFWCQAIVTEERLVPALNVISDYYNIPNDIAGATLMAAGASSPELFSSFVSLFITHSSLGLGTIVGSEIFNQLVICAGSVYASKTGTLQLDKAIVAREVGFYALAIILLYIALQDVRPAPDDPTGPDHIYVSFWEACMVFSGYIIYVIVCANMEAIVAFFSKAKEGGLGASGPKGYGSLNTHKVNLDEDVPRDMAYVTQHKNLSSEPKANWKEVEYIMPRESFQTATTGEEEQLHRLDRLRSSGSSISFRRGSSLIKSLRQSIVVGFEDGVLVDLIRHTERPTEFHSIHDLEDNEITGVFRCFLWQQSPFYTKARFGSHAWHLRWFTISEHQITSVPDRQDPEKHRMRYPRCTQLHVDDDRLIIRMVNPHSDKRDFTVMAPSKKIYLAVLEKLEGFMRYHTTLRSNSIVDDVNAADDDDADVEGVDNADAHMSLVEFPDDAGIFELCMWVFLFPIRFIMHWTLPDVRHMDSDGDFTPSINTAFFSTFMCLVWLVIGSYAMVASLEGLAELMDIPDAVIGFTVSAAGTSLPNYVASKVAAENGFGNQAVSNAFGSNTFNIMVGLGLPWMLYTSFGTGFEPYHGLPAEGILESIIILATVLLVFIVLMFSSGFMILKWHGILFMIMYVAYIVYAIAEVYLK